MTDLRAREISRARPYFGTEVATMNLSSKVVWKDAADLGLSVVIRDRDGYEHGLLGVGPADLEARLDGPAVLSIAALSADGDAFIDLVRQGDLR